MTAPRRADVGPHLGADVAALADGQLRGAARERALGHVAVCDLCRAEVEDQRGLKAELSALPAPDEPTPLRDLLLGLGASGFVPLPPVRAAHGDAVDPTRSSRTRSMVLAGVAIGVLGGGLAFAMVERAGTGATPGAPSTNPFSAASEVPNAVVMVPGGARRKLPLVADLQHH